MEAINSQHRCYEDEYKDDTFTLGDIFSISEKTFQYNYLCYFLKNYVSHFKVEWYFAEVFLHASRHTLHSIKGILQRC